MADVLDYGEPADGMEASRDSEYSRGSLARPATGDSAYGRSGYEGGTSSWQDSYDEMDSMDVNDRPLLDDAMEAEMRAWEASYDGLPDEYDTRREAKLTELVASRKQGGARFYALPRDEAVRAGARRGVTSAAPAASELQDAELMGSDDAADQGVATPEAPQTIGQGLDMRFSVLHMQGLPITQCSTSRLFAYVTHFGAQPLGLEWVNDSSCNIVFSDANAARIAIEYLCPPIDASAESSAPLPTDRELDEAAQIKRMHDLGENSEEAQAYEWPAAFMQSVLTPRKAHRFPAKLYNAPERDAALELFKENGDAAQSKLPDDVPEIYREMEMEDRRRQLNNPKQKGLANLRSNLWLRWAVESLDVKGGDAAKRSKWYREHGRDAGREVVSKMLDVGGAADRLELLPSAGKRGRRERNAPRETNDLAKLDRELDTWRENGEQETFEDRWNDRSAQGSERRRRRGKDRRDNAAGMEIVDEDLEMEAEYSNGNGHRRDRSASPMARGYGRDNLANFGDGKQVRVRGRGRMRAPSAWDNGGDDDLFGNTSRHAHGSARGGGMQADDLERHSGQHRGGRRRGGRGERNDLQDRLRVPADGNGQRPSPSLASRFGGHANSQGLGDRIL